MSLKSWFRQQLANRKPPPQMAAAMKVLAGATTNDGAEMGFEMHINVTGSIEKRFRGDTTLQERQLMKATQDVFEQIVAAMTFEDIKASPDSLCEKAFAPLKASIKSLCNLELQDIVITQGAALDEGTITMSGSAQAAFAARAQQAADTEATAKILVQGLGAGIKINKPLALKRPALPQSR